MQYVWKKFIEALFHCCVLSTRVDATLIHCRKNYNALSRKFLLPNIEQFTWNVCFVVTTNNIRYSFISLLHPALTLSVVHKYKGTLCVHRLLAFTPAHSSKFVF